MYEILFSQRAKKEFENLDKTTQKHVIGVLERIRNRPEKFVSKLAGYPGYRLRAGKYRIILDIEKERLLILVLKVGHRKNIYKLYGQD